MSDSRLAEAAHFSFARHETFAPRFGWLHKAYVGMKDNPEVFLADDGPVQLGVGKNMVYSMRYWSKAFKLAREYYGDQTTSRAMLSYPTWEARWLFGDDGADPYLEETGSLWLLHWWLLSTRPGAKSWAPSWYVAFHLAPLQRFTAQDMTQLIIRHVNLSFPEGPVEASIAKDVTCIAQMYAPARRTMAANSPGAFEDLLAGPFRELGLIEHAETFDRTAALAFTTGSRTSLPPRIVAYACLDYAARTMDGAGSISLARLANEPGSPGRAFRVREPDIAKALEKVIGSFPQLQLVEAVGQRSLAFSANPFELAWDVLDQQYGNVTKQPGFPTRQDWGKRYPQLAASEQRELRRQDVADQLPNLIEENA